MQTNKWKIGDILYRPNGIEPLSISRCLIIWVSISDHALSMNYNSWKKLDEYDRWDQYQVEYVVMEESREWLRTMRYTEESLYTKREDAMEFVYKKAKEVLGIENSDEGSDNQESE